MIVAARDRMLEADLNSRWSILELIVTTHHFDRNITAIAFESES